MWSRARALLRTTALRMALRHALLQVLALAAAVVRAHGGRLVIADTPSGGLTARLDLPLVKEAASWAT